MFLDRDGVINRTFVRGGTPRPPQHIDEVEILPGVGEACRMLREGGYLLIVVTNQPDVARGTRLRATVEDINRLLVSSLPLDDVRVCYHDDSDACECRKPKPGLLVEAARKWEISLTRSWMVGDRWRDIEAGRRAGCRTVAVVGPAGEVTEVEADATAASLRGATEIILGRWIPSQGE